MLVPSSLADLPAADGQRGTIVVYHKAVQLVAGTLLADVIAAQLPELFQLLGRHLDGVLEQNPDYGLQEGWCRQRAQVRPVGLVLRQQRGRVQGARDCYAVILVAHELQQLHDLVQLIVVASTLKRGGREFN